MSSGKPVHVTEKGLAKLQTELDHLCSVRRLEIAEALHDAQGGGDTVDNTEYQYVRYEQLLLETRIAELQQILSRVQLIQTGNGKGVAQLGSTVVIQDEGSQLETYTIVGPAEADPSAGQISNECPLGLALVDHKAGEDIDVLTPDGMIRYRIVAVT